MPEITPRETNDRDSQPRGRGRHTGGRSGRGGRGRRGAENSGRMREATNTVLPSPGAIKAPLQSSSLSDPPKEDDGDAEDAVCFICANPVVYHSIIPCGHSTCHICSLRMRALYGKKACAHCRTESDFVVFAPNEDKKYNEYDDASIVMTDPNLGIKYATASIHDDTVLLLRYNCPEPSCDIACVGWKSLHGHVKSAHDRLLCRLCTRNKKVFTHEHSLFTLKELKKHEREGDDLPGAPDQSGFKGHPECGFCFMRFYSNDELFNHCREAHERCFICDRSNYTPNQQQYYLNYDALVVHFQRDHFLCPEQECLEKKFVVFESEVDLKAHKLEAHTQGLSKAAKRDARRIDMSHFEPSPDDRGQGPGRDSHTDLHLPRAEQSLRRDELAYQRTLAVQSSQSTTVRTFGGQLSQTNGPTLSAQSPPSATIRTAPVQAPGVPAERAPVVAASAFPPLGTPQARPIAPVSAPVRTTVSASSFPPLVTLSPPAPSVPAFPPLGVSRSPVPGASFVTPQPRPSPSQQSNSPPPVSNDETKRKRHAAVIERASNMLKNDPKKLETFSNFVSEYKNGVQTARELCDSFWSLFNTNTKELGTLVRALAELYDDESKRTGLLTAWNTWRVVNENYPPISGGTASGVSCHSRVLKIKSSTTPSARSAQQGAWGTAAAPSLRVASGAPSSLTRPVASSPWISPASASRPQLVSRTIVTTPVSSATPITSAAEFPSLPQKQPPDSFSTAIRNNPSGGRRIANAWTSPQSNGVPSVGAEVDPKESASGKKKKGKHKQTLFHFG